MTSQAGSILVTGTSSGIGRCLARSLDGMGYRVFAGVRSQADGEPLRASCSDRLTPVVLDVADGDSIRAATNRIEEALGPDTLVGVVNNAGVNLGGVMESVEVDRLRRLFEVNVFGAVAVTQAFIPRLRQSRGRIVNISSAAAGLTTPFGGPYAASKIALEAVTHAFRRELRPWGIFAACVRPGATQSEIWNKSGANAGDMKRRLVPADHVVRAVVHGLTARRPKSLYLVGTEAWAAYLTDKLVSDRVADYVIDKLL